MNNIKEYPKLSNQDLETNLITVEQKISDIGVEYAFNPDHSKQEQLKAVSSYAHHYRLMYYILEEQLKRKNSLTLNK